MGGWGSTCAVSSLVLEDGICDGVRRAPTARCGILVVLTKMQPGSHVGQGHSRGSARLRAVQ